MSDTKVHPNAFVAPTAELGSGVEVGPFAVVEEHSQIGDGTVLAPHAVVRSHVRLGKNNRIDPTAVLGGLPQDLKFSGEETWLEIGDDNHFRESVTVHRATDPERPTRIGSRCLLMVNAHIGHDCQLGDDIILTNDVNLGGHCEIGDGVLMGGMAQVHQHVRIGRLAMVGGSTALARDALPFSFVFGILARHYRLNTIGLRRAGVKGERYKALEQAFRAIRDGDSLDRIEDTEDVAYLEQWLAKKSKRGLASFASKAALKEETG